jgi:hypothetical protein
LAFGIAVQAASGVGRDELQEWPTPPYATGRSPENRPAFAFASNYSP